MILSDVFIIGIFFIFSYLNQVKQAPGFAGGLLLFRLLAVLLSEADTGDKSKAYPHVNELHMILEEFEDRIRQVKSSCATGVEPEKFEFGEKFTGFNPIYLDVWQNVSPGDIDV
jgi:hypothetical protein